MQEWFKGHLALVHNSTLLPSWYEMHKPSGRLFLHLSFDISILSTSNQWHISSSEILFNPNYMVHPLYMQLLRVCVKPQLININYPPNCEVAISGPMMLCCQQANIQCYVHLRTITLGYTRTLKRKEVNVVQHILHQCYSVLHDIQSKNETL
jgi:hypothetical protein